MDVITKRLMFPASLWESIVAAARAKGLATEAYILETLERQSLLDRKPVPHLLADEERI